MTDSGVYEKILEITMATLCSASAMWAAMRAYSWGRWSGKLVVDGSTIAKFVVFAAENIGDVFLVVTGVISCGMYYAYKFQKHAVYFPLTHNQVLLRISQWILDWRIFSKFRRNLLLPT